MLLILKLDPVKTRGCWSLNRTLDLDKHTENMGPIILQGEIVGGTLECGIIEYTGCMNTNK